MIRRRRTVERQLAAQHQPADVDVGRIVDLELGHTAGLELEPELQGHRAVGPASDPDVERHAPSPLDTGKAGLWPGGLIAVHGEGRWGGSINGDAGSLLPVNYDALFPSARGQSTSDWALSEWYWLQGLPFNLVMIAGKVDMAAWADLSLFANRERSQFNNTGLNNNPLAGVFFPYTTLGGWITWAPDDAQLLTLVYGAIDDHATQIGLDTFANGDGSFAFQYLYTANVLGRPTQLVVDLAYSTEEIPEFDISRRFGLPMKPVSPTQYGGKL